MIGRFEVNEYDVPPAFLTSIAFEVAVLPLKYVTLQRYQPASRVRILLMPSPDLYFVYVPFSESDFCHSKLVTFSVHVLASFTYSGTKSAKLLPLNDASPEARTTTGALIFQPRFTFDGVSSITK